MGLFDWLLGKSKRTRSTEDEEEASEPNHSFRWYFFSVSDAMGREVFRAIHKDDDFTSVGGGLGRGLSTAKLRVRLYFGASTGKAPSKEQGTFEGYELAKNKPPKPIGVMAAPYKILSGGGDRAAIIVVLADVRFNDFYSAFRDYLNRKYIESGGLPIVSLLYTDASGMADTLCSFFSLQEEGTPVLALGRKVDFFHPK